MLPDTLVPAISPVQSRVDDLNKRYKHHGATAVMERALSDPQVGKLALVSSFGAESVVLLHLVSIMNRNTPVIFIDTEMLFAETLAYQAELADRLRLTDVRIIQPRREDVFVRDNEGLLHLHDPDACCHMRKTEPLQRALSGFDAWITGRKRYQGKTRAAIDFFENEDDHRIKVNPLAHWESRDLQDYIVENRLPRHPLVAKGFPSIGCAPCTTRVNDGEDPRAGRWRDLPKEECGIHFVDGKVVRVKTVAA